MTVAAVTDGMSQTAFASERLLGSGILNQDLSGWYMYMQSPMPTSADQTYASLPRACPSDDLVQPDGCSVGLGRDAEYRVRSSIAPRNGRSCAIMNGGQMMAPWSGDAMDLPWYMQVPPSSDHPGGVNVHGRGRFGPVREKLGSRASLAIPGIESRRRGHIIRRLLSNLIMRISNLLSRARFDRHGHARVAGSRERMLQQPHSERSSDRYK